jgi:hypothetical protein
MSRYYEILNRSTRSVAALARDARVTRAASDAAVAAVVRVRVGVDAHVVAFLVEARAKAAARLADLGRQTSMTARAALGGVVGEVDAAAVAEAESRGTGTAAVDADLP